MILSKQFLHKKITSELKNNRKLKIITKKK